MRFRLTCVLVLVVASGCAPPVGYGSIVAGPSSADVPTSTAPPAPREVPTETHTGKGSGEFVTSWPADQLGFFTFDCPKCTGNVIIDTDQPVKRVTIHANAAWTATIADQRSLPLAAVGAASSGKGDAVLRLPEGASRVQLTAKTRGNIALWMMSPEKRDLLLNQIGDVQVERDVRGPAYLKVDGYETSWTLTPS
jgi:hypothetical protein